MRSVTIDLDLDDILDKHGLERGHLADYVDAIVRSNLSTTADEMDVSPTTMYKYKNAFADMTPLERSFVISWVMAGPQADLEAASERPEGAGGRYAKE